MKTAKAALKFIAFALWCAICVPLQMIVLLFDRGNNAYFIPQLWHKGVCMIFGIRYEIVGTPNTGAQTLFMSNHLSYLDIPVIGSILRASFVAKSEVAGWPLFGFLSKLQQTQFIERRRTKIKDERDKIAPVIATGRSLILFPEGTSTDGRSVRNFKPSLFSLAFGHENKDLMVQPMTITVLSADGKTPETQDERDVYAWHIDMDDSIGVETHLWAFAHTSGAKLRITFHQPLKASDFDDRKVLASACHEKVAQGLAA